MKLFDLHCDTLYECYEAGKHLRQNDLAIDRDKAAGYAHYAQVFALFCGAREPGYPQVTPGRRSLLDLPAAQRLDAMLQTARAEFAASADWLTLCRDAQDFDRAVADGKRAAFLSIEGAELLHDAAGLRRAYAAGVRLVNITWNTENAYGVPAKLDQKRGLTDEGKALVRALEGYGILPDVSHLSEAGFWDVAQLCTRPFVASHSCSRAVCDHFRNLTDAQFTAIVQAGGLVGINLYGEFVKPGGKCTADDVVRHIEHFCALGGEHNLALGADLDGCDTLPEGIATVADMPLLAEALLRQNYKESTVNGIFYDNMSRFLHRTFKTGG